MSHAVTCGNFHQTLVLCITIYLLTDTRNGIDKCEYPLDVSFDCACDDQLL